MFATRLRVVLLVALTACFAAFAASVFLREPGTTNFWFDSIAYDGAFLLAAALAFQTGQAGGRELRSWKVLATGLLLYGLGGLYYNLAPTLGWSNDTPGIADAFWLAFLPFAFAAIVMMVRRRRSESLQHSWLDALVVGSGLFALSLLIIDWRLNDVVITNTAETITNSVYLLGDDILLVLVVAVTQAFNFRAPASWWLLVGAFFAFAVTDATYLLQVAEGSYVEGAGLDIGWPLSALLFGYAAAVDRIGEHAPTIQQRIGGSYALPGLSILIAGFVLFMPSGGPLSTVATIAAAMTLILAVGRMHLALSDVQRFADRLQRAEVDTLTGILNRRGLQALPARTLRGCSVVALDLDGFKEINESLGHQSGDRALLAATARLGGRIREYDILARLGSDEFAVILSGVSQEQATTVAEGLIRALEDPMTLNGVPIHLSACAGIAQFDLTAPDIDATLREADSALAQAKADGVGIVKAYAGDRSEQSEGRLRLRAEIREELARGGDAFLVHYQPIIDLSDNSVFAVEALVRWQRNGQVQSPATFLGEVMHAGAMRSLTALMLSKSLRQLRERGIQIPVTVNVPPELINPQLVELTSAALANAQSDARLLLIEITEDALVRDPEGATRVLRSLQSQGVRVLLDDFGTGWSGFAMLRDLSVDGLKMDASYVNRMHEDARASSIVRSVATVARDLDLIVIHEGAESDEALLALRELGGGYGQGFALARPMPIDDLARWLELRQQSVTDRA